MATERPLVAPKARVVPDDQYSDGAILQIDQILPLLRRKANQKFGLPEVKFDTPISGLQEAFFFNLCYVMRHGSHVAHNIREGRSLADLDDFRRGESGVPEYVIRMLQLEEPWNCVPKYLIELYKIMVEHPGGLPSHDMSQLLGRSKIRKK